MRPPSTMSIFPYLKRISTEPVKKKEKCAEGEIWTPECFRTRDCCAAVSRCPVKDRTSVVGAAARKRLSNLSP